MNKSKFDRFVKVVEICSEVLIRVGVVSGMIAQILAERNDALSEPSAPESAAQPVSEKSEEIKVNGGLGDLNPEDPARLGKPLREQQ